jgi:hypothetical protein
VRARRPEQMGGPVERCAAEANHRLCDGVVDMLGAALVDELDMDQAPPP